MLTRNISFAIAASVLVGTGCSKEFTGIGEGLPSATYTLQTINGQTLPLTVAIRGGVRIEILSGTFRIESTTRFTSSATYRRTENGQATTAVENCVGTYNVSNSTTGATIAFSEPGAENAGCGVQLSPTGTGGRDRNYTGTWDGANTLAIDFDVTTHSVFTK
jgi:hypothetical protein